MKKHVVYTALFGNYDRLPEPRFESDQCDFVCFTDSPSLSSSFWQIRLVERSLPSPVLMNRLYKILPHRFLPEYSQSLYLDANIEILQDPSSLIDKYTQRAAFTAMPHPKRSCAYMEGFECIESNRAGLWEVLEQLKRYWFLRFPSDFGLSENGILIRRHNDPMCVQIMEAWWKEFTEGVPRDQLGLPLVLWTHKVPLRVIEESPRFEPSVFFKLNPHLHSSKSLIAKVAYKARKAFLKLLLLPLKLAIKLFAPRAPNL